MTRSRALTAATGALLALSAIMVATPANEPVPRREGTIKPAVMRTAPAAKRPSGGNLRKVQNLTNLLIVYKPPSKGVSAPGGRVGGGPRAASATTARVEILGPAHPGRTSKAQPVIYWHLSDAVNGPVDLFLSSADDSEALLDISLTPPVEAGMHRVALADHDVHLAQGKKYKFHVFLRSSGDGPQSTAAIAVLERVATPVGWSAAATTDPLELAQSYADHGLWYDAMEAVSASVERRADLDRAREFRAQLLDQVGLESVAEADRRR